MTSLITAKVIYVSVKLAVIYMKYVLEECAHDTVGFWAASSSSHKFHNCMIC